LKNFNRQLEIDTTDRSRFPNQNPLSEDDDQVSDKLRYSYQNLKNLR
jgi:hypothetical protein